MVEISLVYFDDTTNKITIKNCGDDIFKLLAEYKVVKMIVMDDLKLDGQNITSILESIRNFSQLERISMNGNKLDELEFIYVEPLLKQLRSLKSIRIAGNGLGEGIKLFFDCFYNTTDLEEIDVADNELNDAGLCHLENLLARWNKIKYLNVSRNKFTMNGIKYFALGLPNRIHLQSLVLCECGLGDDSINFLAKNLRNLENLKFLILADNKITEIGFQDLIDNIISQNLSILDVSGNQIKKIIPSKTSILAPEPKIEPPESLCRVLRNCSLKIFIESNPLVIPPIQLITKKDSKGHLVLDREFFENYWNDLKIGEEYLDVINVVLAGKRKSGKSSIFEALKRKEGKLCEDLIAPSTTHPKGTKIHSIQAGNSKIQIIDTIEEFRYECPLSSIYLLCCPIAKRAKATGMLGALGFTRDSFEFNRKIEHDVKTALCTISTIIGDQQQSNNAILALTYLDQSQVIPKGKDVDKIPEELKKKFPQLVFNEYLKIHYNTERIDQFRKYIKNTASTLLTASKRPLPYVLMHDLISKRYKEGACIKEKSFFEIMLKQQYPNLFEVDSSLFERCIHFSQLMGEVITFASAALDNIWGDYVVVMPFHWFYPLCEQVMIHDPPSGAFSKPGYMYLYAIEGIVQKRFQNFRKPYIKLIIDAMSSINCCFPSRDAKVYVVPKRLPEFAETLNKDPKKGTPERKASSETRFPVVGRRYFGKEERSLPVNVMVALQRFAQNLLNNGNNQDYALDLWKERIKITHRYVSLTVVYREIPKLGCKCIDFMIENITPKEEMLINVNLECNQIYADERAFPEDPLANRFLEKLLSACAKYENLQLEAYALCDCCWESEKVSYFPLTCKRLDDDDLNHDDANPDGEDEEDAAKNNFEWETLANHVCEKSHKSFDSNVLLCGYTEIPFSTRLSRQTAVILLGIVKKYEQYSQEQLEELNLTQLTKSIWKQLNEFVDAVLPMYKKIFQKGQTTLDLFKPELATILPSALKCTSFFIKLMRIKWSTTSEKSSLENYEIFLSHAGEHKKYAVVVKKSLEQKLKCFLDKDMKHGTNGTAQMIYSAIMSPSFLCVFTKEYFTKKWPYLEFLIACARWENSLKLKELRVNDKPDPIVDAPDLDFTLYVDLKANIDGWKRKGFADDKFIDVVLKLPLPWETKPNIPNREYEDRSEHVKQLIFTIWNMEKKKRSKKKK